MTTETLKSKTHGSNPAGPMFPSFAYKWVLCVIGFVIVLGLCILINLSDHFLNPLLRLGLFLLTAGALISLGFSMYHYLGYSFLVSDVDCLSKKGLRLPK